MTAHRFALPAFIAVVVVCGLIIGYLNVPGAWYAGLAKPSFNPPNWIFAPVWTVLYVLIGIVGWRVWIVGADDRLRLLWTAQLLLNFAWSPTFFGSENIPLALVIIVALLLVILGFILRARRLDRTSALLFLPYLAWVGFATLLNAAIWRLN